jgi:hypothetical protein
MSLIGHSPILADDLGKTPVVANCHFPALKEWIPD